MRTCIVGTGAIGGLLGARLLLAGTRVTLIDRGERLAAMQRHGLELVDADGRPHSIPEVNATGDFERAGEHDVVLLATKAHEIPEVAPRLPALFGPDTVVVTVQNGIPWWYFERHGGPLEGHRLESVDPRGVIARHVEARRVLGCVAYPAAVVERPGVVRHVEGGYCPVGELDGSESARVHDVAGLLGGAGFKTRILSDLRAEIWLKAWGSLSFNPLSALTRATMAAIARDAGGRELVRRLMGEAKSICDALGVTVRHTIERRIDGAQNVGEHKTSMLQDVEAGRPLEHEALVGAVIEMGRLTRTPTPGLEAVHACLRLLDAALRANPPRDAGLA